MGGKAFNRKTGGSGSKTASPEKKVAVMEFTPHTAGKHQSVTCDTVKEHMLQELQKELRRGHDSVTRLRAGVNPGVSMIKPERKIEEKGSQTSEEQKMKQEGHDTEWQTERKEFGARKNTHDENAFEACAMTFGHCNETMQSRIEETNEFEAKIRNDPWTPMDTIKLRICGQVRAKCECVQPTDTPMQFLTLKQEHGETLGDHNERFKQGQDNLKGNLGDKTLNDCITKTDKYKSESDADERAEQTKTAFKKW